MLLLRLWIEGHICGGHGDLFQCHCHCSLFNVITVCQCCSRYCTHHLLSIHIRAGCGFLCFSVSYPSNVLILCNTNKSTLTGVDIVWLCILIPWFPSSALLLPSGLKYVCQRTCLVIYTQVKRRVVIWPNSVAHRRVAKHWHCKQQPLLGNARNSRIDVFSVVRAATVATQQRGKHLYSNRRVVFSTWSVPKCCQWGKFGAYFSCETVAGWEWRERGSWIISTVRSRYQEKTSDDIADCWRLRVCSSDLWSVEISDDVVITLVPSLCGKMVKKSSHQSKPRL
jgi:hypothetical protein